MEPSEYQRRMKRCFIEEMDLKILLDEFTYAIVNDIHNSSDLPLSYIFLSMAVALCHWSNGALIKGVNFYNIPLILFGILCGGNGMYHAVVVCKIKIYFNVFNEVTILFLSYEILYA